MILSYQFLVLSPYHLMRKMILETRLCQFIGLLSWAQNATFPLKRYFNYFHKGPRLKMLAMGQAILILYEVLKQKQLPFNDHPCFGSMHILFMNKQMSKIISLTVNAVVNTDLNFTLTQHVELKSMFLKYTLTKKDYFSCVREQKEREKNSEQYTNNDTTFFSVRKTSESNASKD